MIIAPLPGNPFLPPGCLPSDIEPGPENILWSDHWPDSPPADPDDDEEDEDDPHK